MRKRLRNVWLGDTEAVNGRRAMKATRGDIDLALRAAKGNISAASRVLGIKRSNLYKRLVSLSLDPESYRPTRDVQSDAVTPCDPRDMQDVGGQVRRSLPQTDGRPHDGKVGAGEDVPWSQESTERRFGAVMGEGVVAMSKRSAGLRRPKSLSFSARALAEAERARRFVNWKRGEDLTLSTFIESLVTHQLRAFVIEMAGEDLPGARDDAPRNRSQK